MSKNRERLWVPEIGVEAPAKKSHVHVEMSMGSLAGYIEIELIDAATGVVKEYYSFPNMILTAGFDGLMSGITRMNDMINTLTIGTGSTAVLPTDLSLDEEVERTTNDGGILDVKGYVTGTGGGPFDLGNPYHFVKKTRVFVENEANFPTLSELGLRGVGSPEFQFTRALIRDVTGSLTTIEKTDQDQLRVTYEIRGFPPTSQITGTFVMADSGVTHSFTSSGEDIDRAHEGTGNGANNGRAWTFGFNAQSGPDPRGFFFELGNFGGGGSAGIKAYASASAPQNPTGTVAEWTGWTLGTGITVSQSNEPAYVSGTLFRSNKATWEPSAANFASGGIQGFNFKFTGNTNGEHIMAMYITPSIKKTDLDRLVLTYNVAVTASLTFPSGS